MNDRLPLKIGPLTLRNVPQRDIPPGTIIRSDDGITRYRKHADGSLRRADPKPLSKKERRRARKGR